MMMLTLINSLNHSLNHTRLAGIDSAYIEASVTGQHAHIPPVFGKRVGRRACSQAGGQVVVCPNLK